VRAAAVLVTSVAEIAAAPARVIVVALAEVTVAERAVVTVAERAVVRIVVALAPVTIMAELAEAQVPAVVDRAAAEVAQVPAAVDRAVAVVARAPAAVDPAVAEVVRVPAVADRAVAVVLPQAVPAVAQRREPVAAEAQRREPAVRVERREPVVRVELLEPAVAVLRVDCPTGAADAPVERLEPVAVRVEHRVVRVVRVERREPVAGLAERRVAAAVRVAERPVLVAVLKAVCLTEAAAVPVAETLEWVADQVERRAVDVPVERPVAVRVGQLLLVPLRPRRRRSR
jgi:hypothetical protein